MIAIQTKTLGLPPTQATHLSLIAEFEVGGNESRVFWRVHASDGSILLHNSLPIPSATHNAWGTDDSVIENYVLQQLNLVRL